MTSPDDPSKRRRNFQRAIDEILDAPAADFAAPMVAGLAAQDAIDHSAQRASLGDSLRVALAGRYAVERELGHGGMATVFLARDPRYDRAVAVKVLERDVVARGGVERFLHEIRIAARLTHPHVLAVHDSGEVNGLLYYVMPYVDGETLRARLTRDRPLPLADAVRLLRELADALAYAHAHGVVHRDLKPENVLLSGGHAIVADFGIAKALHVATQGDSQAASALTSKGIALGTPAYMAPEQAVGDSNTDYRADLYALGVVGYELLAGEHPFGTRAPQALVMAHLTEAPAPLRERRADVPPALDSLIMRLLAKDPADRPQSAEEVLRALDDVSTGSNARQRATARIAARMWSVRTWAIVTVCIVSLVVAAIGAYRTWIGARAPNIASLAVLPFVNTSGEPANEPFTDGLTDELIGTLSRVSGLSVMSRTSSFALKGKALGPRAIAKLLGVGAMLEGSLRREGNRLKVAAQLVGTNDGTIIWSETYDRELVGAFDVQEQIARSIVAALRVKLVARTERTPFTRPTADRVAYDSYLRGRFIFRTRTNEEGSREAARYFEQAIGRDSLFARAYSGLSDAHTRLAVFGYTQPEKEFVKARAAAQHALFLDSTLAEAHVSLGQILMVHDFEWAEAERELRLAVSLDPGYTYARTVLAICLASQGRFAEAHADLDSAGALDPLGTGVDQVRGRVYVYQHKPDSAIRVLLRSLELNPQLDLALQQLGHAYLQKRMYPQALDTLRAAAALSGLRDSAHLAYAYAVAGQPAEARRILRLLLDPKQTRYISPYHIAVAYAGLKEPDEAFRWLDRGFEQRASFVNGANVETAFESLHDDLRWAPLIRRLRLSP